MDHQPCVGFQIQWSKTGGVFQNRRNRLRKRRDNEWKWGPVRNDERKENPNIRE